MHPITSNISIEEILIQKSKMFSSNFLRNPQSFIQKLIKCEQTSDIEMWCRGSWFALFQGRLAQSLSWRPPKVQTHKFPANNIQIEFGNEYNSARLKLHSYVDFVWYLIQKNGDLDQFLKITKSWHEWSRSFIRCRNVFALIGEKWRRSRRSKNQVHEAEPVWHFLIVATNWTTCDFF